METETATLLLVASLTNRHDAFDTGDELTNCTVAAALADLLDTMLIDEQGQLVRAGHAERCEDDCPLAAHARKLRTLRAVQ